MTETDTLPTIEFAAPILGFPGQRRFVLVRVDESGLLFSLRSLDEPGLRFLVMAPAPFFPDYAPEIDDDTLRLLGVKSTERLLVLLVVATGDSAADATVNLLAPIIVNQDTRQAVQVVLSGSELPVHAPLVGV